jgi:putative tricarboxylic transport membrane protein
MKRYDLISSSICFIFGLSIVLYAPEFDLGSLMAPGSGFMPFLSGLLISGFSAIMFLSALFDRSSAGEKVWTGVKFQKLIIIILGLLLFAALIETLGFIVCSFLLMLMATHYAGSQTWLITILVSILSSVGSYVLFAVWLSVPLPKGILAFLAF